MAPLVVKKTVNKYWFWEEEILAVNEDGTDSEADESTQPEITFAVKVKLNDLPANVWGGKYDESQSLLDCQAVLAGNFVERTRQTRNLNNKREIVAWPRSRRNKYWDNSRSVNVSNKLNMAVQEDPDAYWYTTGHLAEAVTTDPAGFNFSKPDKEDDHSRDNTSELNIPIPIGAKFYLHALLRRPDGEFIALVNAKDESYASGNLPTDLRTSVFNFQNYYRGRFFWVSYRDLQSPAVRVKQK